MAATYEQQIIDQQLLAEARQRVGAFLRDIDQRNGIFVVEQVRDVGARPAEVETRALGSLAALNA